VLFRTPKGLDNSHVHGEPKFAFGVVLDESTILEGTPLVPLLRDLAAHVQAASASLAAFSVALGCESGLRAAVDSR
jgi:hypothetical protein